MNEDDAARMSIVVHALRRHGLQTISSVLRSIDTDPREIILYHIHPSYWKILGFGPLNEEESTREYERRFGRGAGRRR